MNRYRKNVFRTAWRNRGSVFGAMLIIAIGIFVFVSMIDTLRNLQDRILDYYKEAQLAEAFASVQGIGTDELSALSDLDGIRAAEGKLSADIRMLTDGQEEVVTLHLVSYDERDTINRLRLSGRFRKDTDIFIGKRMSDIYGFREGQEIRLLMDGSPCTFTYAGVCDGPDYIYSVPPSGAMVPDGEVYDLACVTLPAMEQLTGKAGKRTELGFLLEPGTDFEDVRAGLRERLSKSGLRSLCARKDQVSWNMVDGEMTELIASGTVIPALFMIISVFMTYVVNKKQIERERTLIGTMKAFGMKDGELIGSYLAVGALSGMIGALIGILPAGALGRFMFGMYVDFFNLADPVYRDYAGSRAAGLMIGLLTGVFASWFSVRRITAIAPAQAMRQEAPAAGAPGLSMRLRADFLSPFDKLAFRSVLRHPLRGFLIMLAVAFPFSLLPLLLSFQSLADQMFMDQFEKVQVYDLQLSMPYWTDPERLLRSLESIGGITEREAAGIAAAELSANGRSEYGMLYALDAESSLWHVRDNTGKTFRLPEKGVILNARIAGKLHVEAGDSITVSIPGLTEKTAELPVASVITEAFGSGVYLERTALSRCFPVPDAANTLILNTEAGAKESVKREVLAAPLVSGMVDTEKVLTSYADLMGSMTAMMNMFAVLAAFSGVVLIYNISMISIRERVTELGTILLLGGSRAEISGMLLKEQLFYFAGGILLGIPGGFLIRKLLEKIIVSESYAIVLKAGGLQKAAGFLICLMISLAAWGAETRWLRSISLTELLKERES